MLKLAAILLTAVALAAVAACSSKGGGGALSSGDGGPVSSAAASTATVSVRGAGAHTVGVRVLDNAGNISQQYTLPVNIDLSRAQ